MKKLFLFIFLSCGSCVGAFSQNTVVDITAFGAVPDGKTGNTISIQKAIDRLQQQGGGKIIVPAGRFVTGPLHLQSNIELHFQPNAVLLASPKRLDYGTAKAGALITATGVKNVSITGEGIIDGQADLLVKDIYQQLRSGKLSDKDWKEKDGAYSRRPSEDNRPKLLEFIDCDSVTIKNISLVNGTSWIQNYKECNHVVIDSITVNSTAYWNNDGIDITDCKNVSITHCDINSADDGICLKSENSASKCENVFVANCRIRSSANAFKLGTSSRGGFENITVRDIGVYDTYRSAIALEAVDGGFLEAIDVDGVTAKNTGNAVFIRLGHRNKDDRYSRAKNIRIRNVKVQVPNAKPDKGYATEGPLLKYPPGFIPAENQFKSVSPWNYSYPDSTAILYRHNVFPSSIAGLPGHDIEDVLLENIEIEYEGGADKTINYFPPDSLHTVTEAESDYPEFSMFGELPCWGLYVRHAKGLVMKNIKLTSSKPDFRASCIFNDVKGLGLDNIFINKNTCLPCIILKDVSGHQFKNLQLPASVNNAVKID